jgi:hypothetical protein
MKIDRQGIEEIKSTIETPVRALAERLESKNKLDKKSAEIVNFILKNINKIGEDMWNVL